MVMAAREGEVVVRLKGGDPFIFGRGGEEVEHLQARRHRRAGGQRHHRRSGGVTSLGVPLTHRDHAHGVVFVTGHAKPGDAGTDWKQLAATARDARLTLVIYMGVSQRLASRPTCSGRPAAPTRRWPSSSTPACRSSATRCAPWAHCTATLTSEGLGSPSVIVVGDVVRGIAAVPVRRRSARRLSRRCPTATLPLRHHNIAGRGARRIGCSTNSTNWPKATANSSPGAAWSPACSRSAWPACVSWGCWPSTFPEYLTTPSCARATTWR
jgi:siroheme synthase